jgi:hypothetical protein
LALFVASFVEEYLLSSTGAGLLLPELTQALNNKHEAMKSSKHRDKRRLGI